MNKSFMRTSLTAMFTLLSLVLFSCGLAGSPSGGDEQHLADSLHVDMSTLHRKTLGNMTLLIPKTWTVKESSSGFFHVDADPTHGCKVHLGVSALGKKTLSNIGQVHEVMMEMYGNMATPGIRDIQRFGHNEMEHVQVIYDDGSSDWYVNVMRGQQVFSITCSVGTDCWEKSSALLMFMSLTAGLPAE